jgi:hypothetical protein
MSTSVLHAGLQSAPNWDLLEQVESAVDRVRRTHGPTINVCPLFDFASKISANWWEIAPPPEVLRMPAIDVARMLDRDELLNAFDNVNDALFRLASGYRCRSLNHALTLYLVALDLQMYTLLVLLRFSLSITLPVAHPCVALQERLFSTLGCAQLILRSYDRGHFDVTEVRVRLSCSVLVARHPTQPVTFSREGTYYRPGVLPPKLNTLSAGQFSCLYGRRPQEVPKAVIDRLQNVDYWFDSYVDDDCDSPDIGSPLLCSRTVLAAWNLQQSGYCCSEDGDLPLLVSLDCPTSPSVLRGCAVLPLRDPSSPMAIAQSFIETSETELHWYGFGGLPSPLCDHSRMFVVHSLGSS